MPADELDGDGDGVSECDGDCDPADSTIFPGAPELCDAVDRDCDGDPDDGAIDGDTWYADSDGDGFGGNTITQVACTQPTGFVELALATDCDDLLATVYPGATELCDGLDNDCDTVVPADELDGDGDGISECDGDCDPTDPTIFPGAPELCDAVDRDCDGDPDDGAIDGDTWYADSDGDGFGGNTITQVACTQPVGFVELALATDCDDLDADTFPGATELCDAIDNDCDTVVPADELDGDGDGVSECAGDCVPTDASIHPGADELCDAADLNCDGDPIAGAVDQTTFHADADGDGYGSPIFTTTACTAPTGYVEDDTDCSDLDASVYPGAPEECDGVDDDCDTTIDEDAIDALTWWLDDDSDGYGDSDFTEEACSQPTGYVDPAEGDDCDDADPAVNPGADELCNGIDDDCDGNADAGALGLGETCAAIDCADILATVPTSTDDVYWIDPLNSGAPYEVFCDMSNDGGGWTLVANVDDTNDPYFGGHSTFYGAEWIEAWESDSVRNPALIPTLVTDVAVTTKYRSYSEIAVTDLRIAYKDDGLYFLGEGLTVNDTLDSIFQTVAPQGSCAANFTTVTQDRFPTSASTSPYGLNCNDPNEGWYPSSPNAENARIGGLDADIQCCVFNAWLGGMGDRGYSTAIFEKTWGQYSTGVVTDDNIMLFVR